MSANGVDLPRSLPCAIIRGGTSRGAVFRAIDLPADRPTRDQVLVAAFGGPDPMPIDGIGGGDALLNKIAILAPSVRPDADVDCWFGTITPGSGRVKYGANCGNMTAASALFAWQHEWADPARPPLRLHHQDTQSRMHVRPVSSNGLTRSSLDAPTGMPGSGTFLELSFMSPKPTTGSRLLPTGKVLDVLHLPDGRSVAATIVDAGALYVFVRAEDLQLPAPPDCRADTCAAELLEIAEQLRGQAAVLAGLVPHAADALRISPAIPKVALIGPPRDYLAASSGEPVAAHQVHITSRVVSNQSLHNAYPVTGAIATAAAAILPGSIVQQTTSAELCGGLAVVHIGHCRGILPCQIEWSGSGPDLVLHHATFLRSARFIFQGSLFIPPNVWPRNERPLDAVVPVYNREPAALDRNAVP